MAKDWSVKHDEKDSIIEKFVEKGKHRIVKFYRRRRKVVIFSLGRKQLLVTPGGTVLYLPFGGFYKWIRKDITPSFEQFQTCNFYARGRGDRIQEDTRNILFCKVRELRGFEYHLGDAKRYLFG